MNETMVFPLFLLNLVILILATESVEIGWEERMVITSSNSVVVEVRVFRCDWTGCSDGGASL